MAEARMSPAAAPRTNQTAEEMKNPATGICSSEIKGPPIFLWITAHLLVGFHHHYSFLILILLLTLSSVARQPAVSLSASFSVAIKAKTHLKIDALQAVFCSHISMTSDTV